MLMLHRLLEQGGHDILALITAAPARESKIVVREIPRALLEAQACALGFPLYSFGQSPDADTSVHDEIFSGLLERLKRRNVDSVAFADMFLEDTHEYRERILYKHGMQPLFPLWKSDSLILAEKFTELGFKGMAVCVDSRKLDASFVGRELDTEFFSALPRGVDPCGGNGEYHSFIYDGPLFKDRLRFAKGGVVKQGTFYYCNLIET